MNEQAYKQAALEFGTWIANKEDLPTQITQTKGYQRIKTAKDETGILEGVLELSNELKESFKSLFDQFTKEKQSVHMAKHGSKIDYLINKFYTGGPIDTVKVHNKMYLTPM